ncbi:HAD-IIA family hydrolase [Arcobacter sp. YIC-464]|uniref:HAD-IIA family hydrolase n=1 Tax=Arcobacter sp. YIC-464 TaxID=3376631 RepID=UPI003C2CF8AC
MKNISGYIFDLEGVFFKDYHLLPGGKEIIEILKSKGIPFVFLSNLTTKTPGEIHSILMSAGIYVDKEQIITSSILVRDYLKTNYPNANIKVFGSKALKSFIHEEYRVGVSEVDVVVIGMDPKISIADLSSIRKHIQDGKKVVFTNPDYYSPSINGFEFECGVMVELFRPHLKEEPLIIGKPSNFSFEYAIKKLNIPREFIAMIGDTYETDIKGAHSAGILPIHLQTTDDENYNREMYDAHEYKDLQELHKELKASI